MINTRSGTYGEGYEFVADGYFNGQNMVTKEGKVYIVPENYASKSRLVQGDALRLYMTPEGKMLFKQTGPVEREYAIAAVVSTDDGFKVVHNGRQYNTLLSAVVYYRLNIGDKVQITIPKGVIGKWATIMGPSIN